MGSNEWQHAPSIEAMGKGNLKFYLDAAPATGGETRRLSMKKTSDTKFVPHTVDLADRSDAVASAAQRDRQQGAATA